MARYPVAQARLEYLGHSGGAAFRVDALQGRYLLKVHTHPRGGREVLESAMQWLAALRRDTDIAVQEPVRDASGWYTAAVPVPGEQGHAVFCSLVRWVEGERYPGAPSWRECQPMPITSEWAERMGTMVARLHRHAEQWKRPPEFERPRYGAKRMYAWLRDLEAFVPEGRISAADLADLECAARRIEGLMAELEADERQWGLIHADLCPDNWVFCQDEVRPLDFDLCGFGPYALDIGYAFLWHGAANRRAFLRGYEGVRELPDGYEEIIAALLVWGVIAMLKFWAPNPGLIERTCKRYLRGAPFLFVDSGD